MPQKLTEAYQYAFTVSYVERARQLRWRCSDVTFHCSEGALRQQWIQTIREQLTALTSRPKHLLVYINPYGGKQQGKCIYEQKVAPLFACASISTDVIVTEHANHARDHLKTEAELKKYDGVVCVGGDGMFSEIVHGLVSNTGITEWTRTARRRSWYPVVSASALYPQYLWRITHTRLLSSQETSSQWTCARSITTHS
ncbi:ceramide kinase-like [Salvelinus alpinus]